MKDDDLFASQISGGLKNCIDAHGPIAYHTIGSATKRIQMQVYAHLKNNKLREITELEILKEKDTEILRLQHKVGMQRKVIQDLLSKLEATGQFKRTGR